MYIFLQPLAPYFIDKPARRNYSSGDMSIISREQAARHSLRVQSAYELDIKVWTENSDYSLTIDDAKNSQ